MPRGGFSAFAKVSKKDEEPAESKPAHIGADVLRQSFKAAKRLDLEETKGLLEAMRTAVVQKDFQGALANLRERDWGAFKKRTAVARLLGMAWKAPVKSFGISIDSTGFPQVLASIQENFNQPGIKTLSEEVERLLKFHPGDLFGTKAGAMKTTSTADEVKAVQEGRKPAEEKAEAPVVPEGPLARQRALNLGEAKEMLKALKTVCGSDEFKHQIHGLLKRGKDQFSKTLPMFIGQSWDATLKIFEFPNTPAAYQQIQRDIGKHGWNVHVKGMAHEVERLIYVPLGSFFGIPPDAGEEESELPPEQAEEATKLAGRKYQDGDITLTIRHAVQGTELKIYVPQGSTFGDVKEEIAARTGRDEILNRGKLVRKSDNGMFAAYKDADSIGSLEVISVLGADLTVPQEEKDKFDPTSVSVDAEQINWGNAGTAAPTLTRERALSLQQELFHGFSQKDFQKGLAALYDNATTMREFLKGRSTLFLSVQAPILQRYGFSGDDRGVMHMMQAFEPHGMLPEVQRTGAEIERVIRLHESPPIAKIQAKKKAVEAAAKKAAKESKPEPKPNGARVKYNDNAGPKMTKFNGDEKEYQKQQMKNTLDSLLDSDNENEPSKAKPEPATPTPAQPREIQVKVKLVAQPKEPVALKVWTSWTFLAVKEALARELDRQDLRSNIKFVFKENSRSKDWKDFKDTEQVGDRDELFCRGVDALRITHEEFNLTIQHAVEKDEVTLRAWTNWTFKELKEVLAKKFGNDEIRKQARFVYSASVNEGSWMSFKDTEQVGKKAKIQLLGIELPKVEKATAVEVYVKHMSGQSKVQVTVMSDVTMYEVRKAISEQLGRRDILEHGRLVQPQDSKPYDDADLLGKRRRLLYDGPDFAEAPFTAESAHELLTQICTACYRPEIQEKAGDILEVGEAFIEACAQPATDAGFGQGEEALRLMFTAIKDYVDDPVVKERLADIESALQLTPGSVLAMV